MAKMRKSATKMPARQIGRGEEERGVAKRTALSFAISVIWGLSAVGRRRAR
jgi:hypothetical protein